MIEAEPHRHRLTDFMSDHFRLGAEWIVDHGHVGRWFVSRRSPQLLHEIGSAVFLRNMATNGYLASLAPEMALRARVWDVGARAIALAIDGTTYSLSPGPLGWKVLRLRLRHQLDEWPARRATQFAEATLFGKCNLDDQSIDRLARFLWANRRPQGGAR